MPNGFLSIKQKKFLENYVKNGGNRMQAVIDAGYNIGKNGGKYPKSTASTLGANILEKVNNNQKLRDMLEEKGITKERVLDKISKLLESSDQRVVFQVIDLYLKLKEEYPDPKLRIGKIDDIGDILTETDVKEIGEAKLLEEPQQSIEHLDM